ncbi:acetate kinase [Candidatus Termititenax persephonae]|uniref:Acetate kinase n=1 Tax=Candidatus Termititenax persephonae TaxID=2218525 RepID=A0A388TFY3_9BACT|nr:acetate kinase [Candidatus Termititenax persephonae]
MSVLSINCGSSSLKYLLYDWDAQKVLASGLIDRIGLPDSNIVHKHNDQKIERKGKCADHRTAINLVLAFLQEAKVIHSLQDIEGVGHRIVHGGEKFSASARVDDAVLAEIKANGDLAPLHTPPNVVGIESARAVMPDTPQIVIFDTAFHQTMPEHAYSYALDYALAQKYKIRKYGFHGSSHRYVSERAAELLGGKNAWKLIIAHVGNGSSLSAVRGGKCVDTSMGLTPLAGVIMGTRTGDIDPAVVQVLADKLGEPLPQILNRLNKESGMLGVSGYSDQRDIIAGAENGDARCRLALQMQAYSIKKYIGAYLAVLDGADALIFTAGIGENSASFRQDVCADLGNLGIKLDLAKNKERGGERIISAPDSRVKVMVIPTNEEFIIARDVIEIVRGK